MDDPSSRHAVRLITSLTIGLSSLILSGITLTGVIILLITATPVLVLFSPILVPAAVAASLFAAGFFLSGGCGVAAMSALSWVYSYVTGKHPVGADKIDGAVEKMGKIVREMKNRAQARGQYTQFVEFGI